MNNDRFISIQTEYKEKDWINRMTKEFYSYIATFDYVCDPLLNRTDYRSGKYYGSIISVTPFTRRTLRRWFTSSIDAIYYSKRVMDKAILQNVLPYNNG